jgi:cytochrome c oxidase cbb3-type subunit 1
MHPYYVVRAFGGVLFLLGALIMVYNLWKTTKGEIRTETVIEQPRHVAAAAGE